MCLSEWSNFLLKIYISPKKKKKKSNNVEILQVDEFFSWLSCLMWPLLTGENKALLTLNVYCIWKHKRNWTVYFTGFYYTLWAFFPCSNTDWSTCVFKSLLFRWASLWICLKLRAPVGSCACQGKAKQTHTGASPVLKVASVNTVAA